LITVDDTIDPEITCPADMTFECIDDVPPVDITDVIASDNCSVPGVVFVSETTMGFCPTIIKRVYKATDACENVSFCTQTLVVHDLTPPDLSCPADITISCGDVLPEGIAIVSDDCDPDAMVIDIVESEPQGICPMVIVRTYYASDACGNISSCTQRIYLEDHTGPLIECPDDITIECGTAIPLTFAEASDCSGVASVTHVDSQTEGGNCAMTLTRTFTAVDNCGNVTSCTQHIAIEDTTPPVLVCEDLSVQCAEKTCLTFDDVVVNPYAPPVIITNVVAGGITVNVKAYRKGGIQVSAALYNTTTPHPNDLDLGTPNKLYGGAGVNLQNSDGYNPSNNRPAGKAIIIQTPGAPVADDYLLSDSLVFTFSKPVFLESLLAVDFEIQQINSGAKIFMYGETGALLSTVVFSTPPGEDNNLEDVLLETPAVKKLKVYFGSAIPASGAIARICYVNIPEAEVIDCNPTQVTFTKTSSQPDECTTEIIRVYSAIDACGNETLDGCTQRITINTDVERPDIICPPDITIGCNDPLPQVNINDVVVTDNCNAPGTTVEWLFDLVDGTGCNRVVRRIYRAIGGCGNIARCVQYIYRAPRVEMDGQVLLGGPYVPVPDTMRTSINNLLPHSQPYNGAPYNYMGAEYVAVFPSNIVDWILVELRDMSNSSIVIARRAALLTKSGSIVDLDGVSRLSFFAPLTHYYVSVRHRNHLDIISNNTINFTTGIGTVNFTISGVSSGTILNSTSGRYVMIKGDVNGDHQVKYNGSNNDRIAILTAVGALTPNQILSNVYHNADVNMDGSVKYNGSDNDKNAVLNTVGLTTPNNIVVGQFF
jgi:hypothetical protein